MFGPNTHTEYKGTINYSHRDEAFSNNYAALQTIFKNKFNLNNYDVLFIPGSGTIGIECIFWSLMRDINITGCEGSFSERWRRLNSSHPHTTSYGEVDLYCQLETSLSCVFNKAGCVVDAVSSFPFYDIPEDTKIFATCSNKQLGSLVGLSIVCVRKDYWGYLRPEKDFSYLNLARYKKYQSINQTPSSSPTHLYEHLTHTLAKLSVSDLRNKIKTNSQIIVNAVGEEKFTGETVCPALTLKKEHIPIDLARKYQIYGLNSEGQNYHLFTYSCESKDYEQFSADYEKLIL